jgi:hypothetical protein
MEIVYATEWATLVRRIEDRVDMDDRGGAVRRDAAAVDRIGRIGIHATG